MLLGSKQSGWVYSPEDRVSNLGMTGGGVGSFSVAEGLSYALMAMFSSILASPHWIPAVSPPAVTIPGVSETLASYLLQSKGTLCGGPLP